MQRLKPPLFFCRSLKYLTISVSPTECRGSLLNNIRFSFLQAKRGKDTREEVEERVPLKVKAKGVPDEYYCFLFFFFFDSKVEQFFSFCFYIIDLQTSCLIAWIIHLIILLFSNNLPSLWPCSLTMTTSIVRYRLWWSGSMDFVLSMCSVLWITGETG